MFRKKLDNDWAACVGLVRIGNSRWPWRQQRREVWSDMKERRYPLHLRLVPNRFIWYNKHGAKFKL
jgi:hypothetical protein